MLRLTRTTLPWASKRSPIQVFEVGNVVEVDGELAQLERIDLQRFGHRQQRGDDCPAECAIKHVRDDTAVERMIGAAAAALRRQYLRQPHHHFAGTDFFDFETLGVQKGVVTPASLVVGDALELGWIGVRTSWYLGKVVLMRV